MSRRLLCLTGLPHNFQPGVLGSISLSFSAHVMPIGFVFACCQQPLRLWKIARWGRCSEVIATLAANELRCFVGVRDQNAVTKALPGFARSGVGMRVRSDDEPRAQMRVNPPAERLRQNLGSPDRQGSDNHSKAV